jgi:alpha-tubulin suppressor-like RCC1 family protein
MVFTTRLLRAESLGFLSSATMTTISRFRLLFGALLLTPAVVRSAEVAAAFDAPGVPAITAASYTAEGDTVTFTLNHAPANGADLTVVDITGADSIRGRFGNLSQGQKVTLSHSGRTYGFVANYHGGNGNDLVLQSDNTRLMGWGYNGDGQLAQGENSEDSILLPGPAAPTVMAGKTVIAVAAGGYVGLAAASDGTLTAWGRADQTTVTGPQAEGIAYPVDTSGVLAGKTVVGMSAGFSHVLVLCSDGTMAGWGSNAHRQLGDGTTQTRAKPVAVNPSGALSGKTVIAVNSGVFHNVALCSDGTVVSWGRADSGQMGNGSSDSPSPPVTASTSGVLAGKTVVSIATGRDHTIALCSDGTLAAWGLNTAGQLGNGTNTTSNLPVAVNRGGILAGKTVTAISAGANFSMALCSDGTLATWGDNGTGQLGNNSTTASNVPVAVIRTGALAGKTITGIAGGQNHALACCSDGTAAGWGYNTQRQLGVVTSGPQSLVPVLIPRTSLRAGERFVRMISGPLSSSSFALTGSAPLPVATPLAATLLADNAATLNGSVNANGTATSVTFEYGTTPAYGSSISATPSTATGTSDTAVSRRITGLLPGTLYHYRVVCNGAAGTTASPGMTFTTTSQAALAGLTLSQGTLDPGFAGNIAFYDATVPFEAATITATPLVATPGATVRINGTPVVSGSASDPLPLNVGTNTLTVVVTSPDASTTRTYTVTVVRLPQAFRFTSTTTPLVTANGIFANGSAPAFELAFAPAVGTGLTVIRNTSLKPISGSFDNLAHGQVIGIPFGNSIFRYVANYHGGSGNDLVLQWANTRVVGWGNNSDGQIGDNSQIDRNLPVAVDSSGPLAGKTLIFVSGGYGHALALASDGTMLSWGSGFSGELGLEPFTVRSLVPAPVSMAGALAGKTVTAASAGSDFNLVLCSDGTLLSWGRNTYGQLGDGTKEQRRTPVPVVTSGVLAGKRVIAVAAGETHALVLCSDGTMASWGFSFNGALGVSPPDQHLVPVEVNRTGVLAGKTVIQIAAGSSHNLALCSDGTLVSWGWNQRGQLGNNSTTDSPVPVLVNRSGVLSGKTITGIAASGLHSLAVCSDGTLAAWGWGGNGQLGNNSTNDSSVPVAVVRTGFLAGKTAVAVHAGTYLSLALCSDGSLAAWGSNSDGTLGNGGTADSRVPVAVNSSAFGTERFIAAGTGPRATHAHGLLAVPLPGATTAAATNVTGTGAVLRGTAAANGSTTQVFFEYGPTAAYGTTVAAGPASFGPAAGGAVSFTLAGLTPGTPYHYRVRSESASGVTFGNDLTFSTLNNNANLSSLLLRGPSLTPAFDKNTPDYITTLPFSQSGMFISATTEDPRASARIAGSAAGTGGTSLTVSLPVGTTKIPVVVTAEDGVAKRSYQVLVTRLPQVFAFDSPESVPLTLDKFIATGHPVTFALNFAPPVGTRLTAIHNVGREFITGTFSNLAHGQTVILTHEGISYRFVANYYGGSGNDLVLEWANQAAYAWGSNRYGQLGTGGDRLPVPGPLAVDTSGLPAGRTFFALSAGYLHSLALRSDGRVMSWGYNVHGQLGNGSTTDSPVPIEVVNSGALTGKQVIALSAGPFHNLALCSDGTVVAWGYNNHGQLGDGTKASSPVPVTVNPVGALLGKSVISVHAGVYHSFALCSDGTIAAWGYNDEGELGNGSTTGSLQAVAVGGVLAGKTVTSMAAGPYHALAVCTDGTVAAWGYNSRGQLGTGGTAPAFSPVSITSSGVLAGRVVTALAAGGDHSLALCSDGTLAAWGLNSAGQLGDGSTTHRLSPVAVQSTAALAGKTVVAIAAGSDFSQATCSDGSLLSWGSNRDGRLGHPGIDASSAPVEVDTGSLPVGARPTWGTTGSSSWHGLSLIALPIPTSAIAEANAVSQPGGLAAWRELHFGGAPAEVDSSDLGDPDHDGIVNLIEYGFGLDPRVASADALPQWRRNGDYMEIRFTEPPGVTGISYGAKTATDLALADWVAVEDSGIAPEHVFRVPIDRARRFMRLEVTAP